MSKRQGDWRSLPGIRKVRRTLTYTPASYVPVASAPAIYRRRGHRAVWKNRPTNQKPYGFKRGLGIPYGCEGKVWMGDEVSKRAYTNIVMFWLVRDRRPEFAPLEFGKVFNMFDNEPATATITVDMRDRFQVLRRWSTSVTGGTYAHREQVALVKRQNSSEVVVESYLNLYHIVIPVEWFSVVVEHLEIKGILNVPNKNRILCLRNSDEFPAWWCCALIDGGVEWLLEGEESGIFLAQSFNDLFFSSTRNSVYEDVEPGLQRKIVGIPPLI
ncbi:hypothetical protein V6N12_037079 [Hibiscus sabdariffa]|uniref:Capsid protein n=1 Tax=Hibiscus sabdariffa TaxID=183260 RepID=A0ABR1ZSZ9_9ROSI